MAYYARFGPKSGPLRFAAGYYGIGVIHARETRTPIGEALVAGQDRDGRALWRLTIDTIDLPWRFVVIDRQFRPAQQGGRGRGGMGRATHLCQPAPIEARPFDTHAPIALAGVAG